MTKEEWLSISEYIYQLEKREAKILEHLDNQNYGLARQVIYERIAPLTINVED